MLRECGCLPFNVRRFHEVQFLKSLTFNFTYCYRKLFALLHKIWTVWTIWRLIPPAAWSPALALLSPALPNLNWKMNWKLYFLYLETTALTKKITTHPSVSNGKYALEVKFLIKYSRFWMEEQTEIYEDLLWHPNIWQNREGQSSKVCGHVVSNWRHHGTSHWILHHQCSGDSLLCS